jgi:hypothetical protein
MIVLSGLVSCLRVSLLSGFCVRCVWPVFFFFSYVRLFKVTTVCTSCTSVSITMSVSESSSSVILDFVCLTI